VKIIDGIQENVTEDEILREIRAFQTDIVGLTITTIAYQRALQIARLIKEQEPEIQIVAGGQMLLQG